MDPGRRRGGSAIGAERARRTHVDFKILRFLDLVLQLASLPGVGQVVSESKNTARRIPCQESEWSRCR